MLMKKTLLLICCFFLFLTTFSLKAQTLTMIERMWFESATWPSGDTTGGSDVWGWTDASGEDYAIMGTLYGIHVVRASDQKVIDSVAGPENMDYYYHRDIKTYRNYAYVTNEMTGTNEGLMIVDLKYLPDSVHFVKSYPTLFSITSHNLSIDTANAFAYVLTGSYDGVRMLYLGDPENPVDSGMVSVPEIHDVFARNDTLWIAEGNNASFSVWDVSDKTNPTLITRIYPASAGYAHNIWPTEDGKKFITTEETGYVTVKFWDMTNPGSVTLEAEYLAPCSLAHNVHVKGPFCYVSHYESGITILDISDFSNPIEVAAYDTYTQRDSAAFYGCWGAFPFSKNQYVYASDLEGYLTILHFDEVVGTDVPGKSAISLLTYPNPVTDFVYIRIGEDLGWNGDEIISLRDMQGRLLGNWSASELEDQPNRLKIDLDQLGMSRGVYLLNIEKDNTVYTKKITVN